MVRSIERFSPTAVIKRFPSHIHFRPEAGPANFSYYLGKARGYNWAASPHPRTGRFKNAGKRGKGRYNRAVTRGLAILVRSLERIAMPSTMPLECTQN